ncbi:MAG: hydrogen gas-evolving membrane-bound hydrogenase subunit E [Planctomycetota bacterium]
MSSGWPLLIAVFAPMVCGGVGLFLPRQNMGGRVALAAAGPVIALVLLVAHVAAHGRVETKAVEWVPGLHMNFAWIVDATSVMFNGFIAGIGLLIILYARAYLGPKPDDLYRFYPMLGLFMTAMLGLTMSDNLPTMLLFWEMTSISSFLLIGWKFSDKVASRNAMQAFLVTGLGGLVLMGGLILLAIAGGNEDGAVWRFSEMDGPMQGKTLALAFVLLYVGIAAKSAQWPLHFWLPGAMNAPTPVSAYLHSAAMVKAGIYLLARLWEPLSNLDVWPLVVIPLGAITMAYGAVMALRQDGLKAILAYTTISQLGLLATAFGLGGLSYDGEANLIAPNLQILNHALYKAPLFILAGAIIHGLHREKLSDCIGLYREGGDAKLYATLFLIGSFALAAFPLSFSFSAKEMFLYQVAHSAKALGVWFWPLAAAAVIVGLCNVALFVRFLRTFMTAPTISATPPEHVEHHDVPVWHAFLWVPAALLIGLQFVLGIVPIVGAWLLDPLAGPTFYDKFATLPWVWELLTPGVPLLLSGLGIFIGLIVGATPLCAAGPVRPWPEVFSRLFDGGYWLATVGGRFPFEALQNGSFRSYIFTFGAALLAILGWGVAVAGWPEFRATFDFTWEQLPGYLIIGITIGVVIMAAVVQQRIIRVLLLGATGLGMAGLYYLYAAPDLALTQISIEIVSIILFLLVLTLLPNERAQARQRWLPRGVIAILIGLAIGGATYVAATADTPAKLPTIAAADEVEKLGDYFLRNSYEGTDSSSVANVYGGSVARGLDHLTSFDTDLKYIDPPAPTESVVHKGGGGSNVVNVILVDFRGFDTMGEIVVLGIAVMGVWTLMKRTPDEMDEPRDSLASPGEVVSPILRQAVRFLIPVSLVFAVYVFFKGHQEPGGGFVGGLVAAVTIVVYRMTFGGPSLRQLMPVSEHVMIAVGLILAGTSALGPLFFGLPLLTTNHGYIDLPGGVEFHWATVLIFDAGVALVVIGTVVGMIDVLSNAVERRAIGQSTGEVAS